MKLKRFISSILLSSTVLQSFHVPFAMAGHEEDPKRHSASAKLSMTPDEFRELIPTLYQAVVNSEGEDEAQKYLEELFKSESPRKGKPHRGRRAGKKHKNHDGPLSKKAPQIIITSPPSEPVKEPGPLPSAVVEATPSEPIASSKMPQAVEHNGKRRMSKAERDRLKKEHERQKKAEATAKSLEEEKARKKEDAQRLKEEQRRQDEELRRLELESQQAREESEKQATAKPTYESTLVTLNAAFAETNIDKRYAQFAQAGSAFADLKDDKCAQAKVLLLLLTGLWKPEGQFNKQTFLERYLNQALRTVFGDQFQGGIAKFIDPHAKQALDQIEKDPEFERRKQALIQTLDPNAPSEENLFSIESMLYKLYRDNPLAKQSDEHHQTFISQHKDNPDVLTAYGLMLWGTPVADFLDISVFCRTPDQMIRAFEVLVNALNTYKHPFAYDVVSRFINLREGETFFDKLEMIQSLKVTLRHLLENPEIIESAASQGSVEVEFKRGRLYLDQNDSASAWKVWNDLANKGHVASIVFIYRAKFGQGLDIESDYTEDQLKDMLLKSFKHPSSHSLRRDGYHTLMEMELRKIAIAQTEEEIQSHLNDMKNHLSSAIAYFKDFPVEDQVENFRTYFKDLKATFKTFHFEEDDDKFQAFNTFLHYANWSIYKLALELKLKKPKRHNPNNPHENSVAPLFCLIESFPLASYHMAEAFLETSLGQYGFYKKMLELLKPVLNAKAEGYCEDGNSAQKAEFEAIQKKALDLDKLLKDCEDVLTEHPHRKYIDESTEKPKQFQPSALEKEARASTIAPERAQKFWAAFNDYIEKGEGTSEYIRALVLYQMGEIHGEIDFVDRMDDKIKTFIENAMAQHSQMVERLLKVDDNRIQNLMKIFKAKNPEKRPQLLTELRSAIDNAIQNAKEFCELYSLNPNYQYLHGAWMVEHDMKELATNLRALGIDPANPPSQLMVKKQGVFAQIYAALNQGVKSLKNAIEADMVEASAFVLTHPLLKKQFPDLNPAALDDHAKNFQNMDDVLGWYEKHSKITPESLKTIRLAGIPDYLGGFAAHALIRLEQYRDLFGENIESTIRDMLLESAQKGSFKAFESLVLHYNKPIIKGHIPPDTIRKLGQNLLEVPGIGGLPPLHILVAKAQTFGKDMLTEEDIAIVKNALTQAVDKLSILVPRPFISQKTYYYELLLLIMDEMKANFPDQFAPQIGKIYAQTIWQIIKETDMIIQSYLPYLNDDLQKFAVMDLDQERAKSQFQIKYARDLLEIAYKAQPENALVNLRFARMNRLAFGDQDPENLEEANQHYLKAAMKEYTYDPANKNETVIPTSLSLEINVEYNRFKELRRQYDSLPD